MTAALRKASERRRRAARGEVALSGWLSAEDHAALTQMARDSGMTQAQVVSGLIGMVGVKALMPKTATNEMVECINAWADNPSLDGEAIYDRIVQRFSVRHSDLTAAIGLNTAKAGNEGEG